jgi:hypothetical protein
MKKRLLFVAFVIALAVLVVAGCKLPIFSELAGTWKLSSGGVTETLTFGPLNFTYDVSGAVTGKMKCSLDDVNEDIGHVRMTVTSSSGVWSGITPDTVIYMYYQIISDSFYFAWSDISYPSVVAWGPYTK